MTTFIQAMWQVLLDLAPFLLLGAAVAGLLHVVLPKGFIQRQFSGRGGVLKAVLCASGGPVARTLPSSPTKESRSEFPG